MKHAYRPRIQKFIRANISSCVKLQSFVILITWLCERPAINKNPAEAVVEKKRRSSSHYDGVQTADVDSDIDVNDNSTSNGTANTSDQSFSNELFYLTVVLVFIRKYLLCVLPAVNLRHFHHLVIYSCAEFQSYSLRVCFYDDILLELLQAHVSNLL